MRKKVFLPLGLCFAIALGLVTTGKSEAACLNWVYKVCTQIRPCIDGDQYCVAVWLDSGKPPWEGACGPSSQVTSRDDQWFASATPPSCPPPPPAGDYHNGTRACNYTHYCGCSSIPGPPESAWCTRSGAVTPTGPLSSYYISGC